MCVWRSFQVLDMTSSQPSQSLKQHTASVNVNVRVLDLRLMEEVSR